MLRAPTLVCHHRDAMKIAPFRGYRYRAAPTRDVSAVVAPPYDQISPAQQDHLHGLGPHNIVRLTLPRDGAAAYQHAREVLERWVAEGVWGREPEPALYPYEQTYTVDGTPITRTGVIALGEVSDYRERIVLPHERTHAGPKRERLALLEATGADIGLLFMLTGDPGGELRAASAPRGEPIAEARDLRGEHHRLWRLTGRDLVGRVQALMAERTVIIADGHHRYETAVEYARHHPERRAKLMAFFALEAPGLTILPNHRLVHGVEAFGLARLVDAARPWFAATALHDPRSYRPTNRSPAVVTAEGAVALTLRDDGFDRIAWPPATSPAWRRLAVSVLHEGILKPLLGIDDAKLDAGTHVAYTADQGEAIRSAGGGDHQAAFLIAPTTPAELAAIVRGGEVLPQKSTHFYPKLLDGLVFSRVGEEA
jgi:uncharacterized protein (DUF1015 family)